MRWSYACYGKTNAFVRMNCPWGSRIAVRRIAFGSKPGSNCPAESGLTTPFTCCIPACGDCLVEDVGFRSGIVQQSACSGKTACSVRAQRAAIDGCASQRFSNYMMVMYDCVPEFSSTAAVRSYNRSMAEEVCAVPTFNHNNVVWPPQGLAKAENPFPVPPGRARSTHSALPVMPATVGTTPDNAAGKSPDAAKEGAIIGAVVGGVALLVILALIVVICCCVRWKSEEDDSKVERQSNLSFMDPLTLQPSYHAFGSVDGSSMAERVEADSVSVWSSSTDPGRVPNPRQSHANAAQCSYLAGYTNDLCNGFVPRKPPIPSTSTRHNIKTKGSRSTVGRQHLGNRKHGSVHGLPPIGIRTTKVSKPRMRKQKDRLYATYHSHVSGRRHAKDEYYRGKGRTLKGLESPRHNRGSVVPSPPTDPPVDKQTLASWWLMGAMRTNSDPIKRFQHTQDVVPCESPTHY